MQTRIAVFKCSSWMNLKENYGLLQFWILVQDSRFKRLYCLSQGDRKSLIRGSKTHIRKIKTRDKNSKNTIKTRSHMK